MSNDALTHPTDALAVTHALAESATTAGYAPSIHNTQPWRWRLTDHTLDLFTERSRVLAVTDPDARLATLSCGVALHHARMSLAAKGWQVTTTRMPEPADPDHLARLHIDGRAPTDQAAALHLRTIPLRHTDRRPVTAEPVEPQALEAITAAVIAEGTGLHTLTADQIIDLAGAADHAQRSEAAESAWHDELANWTGGTRPTGTGIPDATIPDRATRTTVPGRDFGHHGNLPISADHAKAAVFVMLYGRADQPRDWLRAGEALSAGKSLRPRRSRRPSHELRGTRVAQIPCRQHARLLTIGGRQQPGDHALPAQQDPMSHAARRTRPPPIIGPRRGPIPGDDVASSDSSRPCPPRPANM